MNTKRQKDDEEYCTTIVVSVPKSTAGRLQKKGQVAVGLQLQAKRELLQRMAPQYHDASAAQKKKVLDAFTSSTGYHRKYAMWLLNHPQEGQLAPACPHPRHYGPEVQEALVLVWEQLNCVCAKRLIPFLPTWVDILEQHGSLHLSQTCREQLLSMSVATAERLLRAQRRPVPHGLSTTRAGTLLKQQIPIRTFAQWNETRPGFVEVDVVAHCGASRRGSSLSTLCLTDIATGWTECLPLLYKSQETVLEALQHARTRFPFPLLGLDTDNGTEFLNEALLRYCDQEQLTFTRGRPEVSNDQCFVEQKNKDVVRQIVGYARFVGQSAYTQLGELYQAVRLYINCFQPSMKLQAKAYEGRRVQRSYDAAKTPLQRLLLSNVLPASHTHALQQGFQMLDPVQLFEQVKTLQQMFLAHAIPVCADGKDLSERSIQPFCIDSCLVGDRATNPLIIEPIAAMDEPTTPPSLSVLLDWPRTRHDPFKEAWKFIASQMVTHPECGSGEMLRKLQQEFPNQYQSSHLRTLQRGMRKIRARLCVLREAQRSAERMPFVLLDAPPMQTCERKCSTKLSQTIEAEALCAQEPVHNHVPTGVPAPDQEGLTSGGEEGILGRREGEKHASTRTSSAREATHTVKSSYGTRQRRRETSIEQAIQAYLESLKKGHRQPKTLEWHQTALGLFQEYLQQKSQSVCVTQITRQQAKNWLTFLHQTPNARGLMRSIGTVSSYARSAHAFCQWLVRQKYLDQNPWKGLIRAQGQPELFQPLTIGEWNRLREACGSAQGVQVDVDHTMRNQALLWVLAETGIRMVELCALRLGDVDWEQESLKVKGKGSRWRWVPLKRETLQHLRDYVECVRLQAPVCKKAGQRMQESLFVAETGQPLSTNGVMLLFHRLRTRAGITRKGVNPSLLRDTFAVDYMRAGGGLDQLREVLGQEESARVKRTLGIR